MNEKQFLTLIQALDNGFEYEGYTFYKENNGTLRFEDSLFFNIVSGKGLIDFKNNYFTNNNMFINELKSTLDKLNTILENTIKMQNELEEKIETKQKKVKL